MPTFFLLEVGTEELPAKFVDDAIEQWRSHIPSSLKEHSFTIEAIEIYGTPRRLAVLIKGLPTQQPDREEEIKGPLHRQLSKMATQPRQRRVLLESKV